MEVRKCVSGEWEGEEKWLKVDWWIESERWGNKKQVSECREKRKRQLRGSALSSQLLWFKWADSTQISQRLTAVRHAFPLLFLTRTPISGCSVQEVSRLLSPKPCMCASMCLGVHVLGVCVLVWRYHGMPIYVSAASSPARQYQRLLFLKASGVCSASNHVRCDKFKNSLHVRDPALAQRSLLTMGVCP